MGRFTYAGIPALKHYRQEEEINIEFVSEGVICVMVLMLCGVATLLSHCIGLITENFAMCMSDAVN